MSLADNWRLELRRLKLEHEINKMGTLGASTMTHSSLTDEYEEITAAMDAFAKIEGEQNGLRQPQDAGNDQEDHQSGQKLPD